MVVPKLSLYVIILIIFDLQLPLVFKFYYIHVQIKMYFSPLDKMVQS